MPTLASKGPTAMVPNPAILSAHGIAIPANSNVIIEKIKIPNGIKPGEVFAFQKNNEIYQARCPPATSPGQEILISIPGPPTPDAFSAHPLTNEDTRLKATLGKELLMNILPFSAQGNLAVLKKNHSIDENDPRNLEHGVVSGRQGDKVAIIAGSIENGMPSPYEDYCLVQFENGKIGKISRFVLQSQRPVSSKLSSPPKAIT